MTMLFYRTFASWCGLAAAAFGAVACVGTVPADADSEDVTSRVTASQVTALFHAVDDNCAGNDNGRLLKFDAKKFDAKSAQGNLVAADKDAFGVDCSDERGYSTSRQSGVAMFLAHIHDSQQSTASCLASHLSAAQRVLLEKVVGDATNLGVFASVFSGGDNAEACDYYRFDVYRRDGMLIELTFNYTD